MGTEFLFGATAPARGSSEPRPLVQPLFAVGRSLPAGNQLI